MSAYILYHYTTMETFFSMLENSLYSQDGVHKTHLIMWATHYAFLNDPIEYIYFSKILKEQVSRYAEKNGTILSYKQLSKIDEFTKCVLKFVLSFSSKKDDLTMWRGYGDNGNGISLEFDFSDLPCEPSDNTETDNDERSILDTSIFNDISMLNPCKYNNIDINEEVLKSTFDYITNSDNSENDDQFHKYEKARNATREYFSLFKHYKYECEGEWRLVEPGISKKIKHRRSNDIIIPYIEIKVPLKCLKRVIVGPCANSENTVFGLQSLLSSKRLYDINVTLSEVPYRDRL